MSYIDDLEHNVKLIEEHLDKAIECINKGWLTAADVHVHAMKSVLKSAKFCVSCAKKKRARMEENGKDPKEFRCVGGCIKAGVWDDFAESNRRLRYVLSIRAGLATEEVWPFKGKEEK